MMRGVRSARRSVCMFAAAVMAVMAVMAGVAGVAGASPPPAGEGLSVSEAVAPAGTAFSPGQTFTLSVTAVNVSSGPERAGFDVVLPDVEEPVGRPTVLSGRASYVRPTRTLSWSGGLGRDGLVRVSWTVRVVGAAGRAGELVTDRLVASGSNCPPARPAPAACAATVRVVPVTVRAVRATVRAVLSVSSTRLAPGGVASVVLRLDVLDAPAGSGVSVVDVPLGSRRLLRLSGKPRTTAGFVLYDPADNTVQWTAFPRRGLTATVRFDVSDVDRTSGSVPVRLHATAVPIQTVESCASSSACATTLTVRGAAPGGGGGFPWVPVGAGGLVVVVAAGLVAARRRRLI